VIHRFARYAPALALFGLALAVRLYGLDSAGLWFDEVESVDFAQSGLNAIFTDRFGILHNQQALYYAVIWLMTRIADPATTAVWVRLPSALAGAAAPLVLAALGRAWFTPRVGWGAGVLLVLAPIHLKYSQDGRSYAWLVLLALGAVYSLWQAVQTDERRWWAGFVACLGLALLINYMALVLLLPALAPYLAWVLFRRARAGWSRVHRPLTALAVVGGVALGVAADALGVAGNPLQVAQLTPDAVGQQVSRLVARSAQIGLDAPAETAVQWALLALALIGAVLAVRARAGEAVALAAGLILLPGVGLAVLQTGNVVFIRYGLFALPFYLLLVAAGIGGLAHIPRAGRALVAGVALGVGLAFIAGAWYYSDPPTHRRFADYPDYRGVAGYLAGQAGPGDRIIVADDPALGTLVMRFYWHNRPPAPTFDVRDPRLFATVPAGRVFWVLSFGSADTPDLLPDLGQSHPGWVPVTQSSRVAVVMQPPGTTDLRTALDKLVTELEAQQPDNQPPRTLRAIVTATPPQAAAAAALYAGAGVYYPVAAPYLRTADGYAAGGQPDRAWIEADLALFMEPGNPAVHQWMAEQLNKQGYVDLSKVEAAIAVALAGGP
jgi:mannosyltransferase